MEIDPEATLSWDEQHYRQVLESVADGLLLLEDTPAGLRIVALNPAAAQVLGVAASAREFLVNEALMPALAAALEAGSRECLASGQMVATQFELHGAPRRSSYRLTLLPVSDASGRAPRVTGVIHDVTQQRELENALHARAEEFRALAENAPDFISRYDTEGRIPYVNRAIERLGRPLAELRGQTSLQISESAPSARQYHECVLDVARSGRAIELEVEFGTDMFPEPAVHQVRFVPEHDQQGNVVSVLGIGRDITELKNNEAKMRALAEHLSLAAQAAQLGIVAMDMQTERLTVDERLRSIFGFPCEVEVTVAMLRAAMLPEDVPPVDLKWQHALATKTAFTAEFRIRRPDGAVRWVEVRSLPQCEADRVASVLAAYRDITQRKQAEQQRLQLEAQLRQAQKLEAIGTLAGGIAHDFNNILGAILGNVALLAQDLGKADPAQSCVAEIHKAAQRGKELVQRLLAFGRPQDQRIQPMRLQSVAEEVVRLLRPTLPATIEIALHTVEGTPPVRIDAGQISQVLMNLCVNAYQAMDERKGRIDIEIGVRDVDGPVPVPIAGRYVVLTVRDNARGMSPDVLERIFEPFYTTKPFGEGSGLGLAMVPGIVGAHGGAVTVDSAIGRGTVFEIYLPALPPNTPYDAFEPAASALEAARAAGERILYIDDEEALVFLADRLFKRLGYRPECFTDPEAAISAFRADPERYDLVITDLSMPGMSGMELSKRLLAIAPNAKVVLASGYVRPNDVEAARAIGICDVVLKPNTVEEMTSIVRTLLQH